MAFVFTTVAGNVVSITSYNINPAVVYLASKQDHSLGLSPILIDYPYYVGKYAVASGEHKVDLPSVQGDFVAILYGSEDAQPFHILDYSVFTIVDYVPCSPPGGVLSKCLDSQTIAAWNQATCSYDSHVCASGSCVNGACTTPPGVLKWKCDSTGTCIQDVNGTYATQAECMAACKAGILSGDLIFYVGVAIVAYLIFKGGLK
jgi:hypothetical protein